MELEPEACYQAMLARDRRFDGRFLTGVVTTGIYCRPVCPVSPPKLRNVRFYACAAAAESDGFRPCKRCRPETSPEAPSQAGVASRLARYFNGDLPALGDLRVQSFGTPFQQRVWQELRRIPAGSTRSYGEIAAAIGSPSAVRAVGAANGANPVGIVVPCHRVIGSDGSLTGFAGGLVAKRWLLQHEAAISRAASAG